MKHYLVINNQTAAICGAFDTREEARKWVDTYVATQNQGLDPEDERNIFPFHFDTYEKLA